MSKKLTRNTNYYQNQKEKQQQINEKECQISIKFQDIFHHFTQVQSYFSQTTSTEFENYKKLYKNQDQQPNQLEAQNVDRQLFIQTAIHQFCSKQYNQYHFDKQQRTLILQSGIKLSLLMMQTYVKQPYFKKSKRTKKFLSKYLFNLTNFLVNKIYRPTYFQHQQLIETLLRIFLSEDNENKQHSKENKFIKRQYKNSLFQVPLLVTNLKISFPFYFIFSIFQQFFSYSANSDQNIKFRTQYFISDVQSFLRQLLFNIDDQQFIQSMVKSICNCLGCLQLPVVYYFFAALNSLVESQFSQNYQSINRQKALVSNFNNQLYSFKNLQAIIEALSLHFQGSYKRIQLQGKQNKRQNSKKIFQDKQMLSNQSCFSCSSTTTDKFIGIKLIKSTSKDKLLHLQQNQDNFHFYLCPQCFFNSDNIQKQNQLKNLLSLLQNQDRLCHQIRSCLMDLVFKNSFWGQAFQLNGIRKIKIDNLICLQQGIDHNNIEKYTQSIHTKDNQLNFSQIGMNLLRTIFRFEYSTHTQRKKKIKEINFSLFVQQSRIFSILILFMNSQSEHLRKSAVNLISSSYFMPYFIQYLNEKDLINLFQGVQQKVQEFQYKSYFLNFQIKKKLVKIVQSLKNRLDDISPTIQALSLKLLFNIKSQLDSSKFNQTLFNYISTLITQNSQKGQLIKNPLPFLNVIKQQILYQCEILNKHKQWEIVMCKLNLTKAIGIILTLFQSHQKDYIFQGEQLRQTVAMMKILFIKMIDLIQIQQNMNKRQNKPQNNQYQTFVINYLKRYQFTKQTILCFEINDKILQKLITLVEASGQISSFNQKQLQQEQKNKCLLKNLKLILQQLFDFTKLIEQNQILSFKKQSKHSKKSKMSQSHYELSNKRVDIKPSITCYNLNRIIKNMIKNKKQLSPLRSQILFYLLQKNYLLNYQPQTNLSTSPSKIQRLILSLQTIKSFQQILQFLQKQIKQCNIQLLPIFIKLYVIICMQINEQRKIQLLHLYYMNVFKYFKKNWLREYEKYIIQQDQQKLQLIQISLKNQPFFIRGLITISIIASQNQKFKKIQTVSTQFYTQIKQKRKDDPNKFSVLKSCNRQRISIFQTQPQVIFYNTLDQIYQILNLLTQHYMPPILTDLINVCLKSICSFVSLHPQTIGRYLQLIEYILKKARLNTQSYKNYVQIIQNITKTKDHVSATLISKLYLILQPKLFQIKFQQNHDLYMIYQKFYNITFYLLRQEIIGIQQLTVTILYGLLIKNKQINTWTKQYLQYLNLKGNDKVLLMNFSTTMIQITTRLATHNRCFFQDQQYFRNSQYFGKINKQVHKAQKVLLQKQIKQYKLRPTFIKKISEIIGGDLNWLRYTNQYDDRIIFFMLKIIQNQKQMDLFELEEIIFSLEKVIKQYYIKILKTSDIYFSEQEQQNIDKIDKIVEQKGYDKQDENIWLMIQKRRTIIIVGQIMFTLIKLMNQKKIKTFKKQIEEKANNRKFTSTTVNIPVNNQTLTLEEQNKENFIFNYDQIFAYHKRLQVIFNDRHVDYYLRKKTLQQLTKQYKIIAKKMYSIIFQNEKPKINKNQDRNLLKNKTKKISVNNIYDLDTQSASEYSDNQSSFCSLSIKQDKNIQNIKFNATKKNSMLPNYKQSTTLMNEKQTKKGRGKPAKDKIISSSVPKKMTSRKLTIISEGSIEEASDMSWDEQENKKKSKKTKISKQKIIKKVI